MPIKSWKTDLVFITFLFLFTCVFFLKILLHPDQIIYSTCSDTVRQYYPWRFFAESMLKEGQLPLWIPYTFSGEPFIANIQTAVFYPLNIILFSIFPAYLAFGYSYLLHIFLAGLFTYILMRYLKLDYFSSFVSAIIYMFNGSLILYVWGGGYPQICSVVWAPLAFIFLDISLSKRSLFYGVIAGIPISFMFLAGHIQIALSILYAIILYFLFKCFLIIKQEKDYKKLSKLFSMFVLALTIGILLSAIQLVPSFELSKYVTRAGGVSYDFATQGSVPPQNLLTFILPNLFGSIVEHTYWGAEIGAWFWAYGYIGFFPLILIMFAFFFKRDNAYVVFFSILAFLSLVFALGKYTPFYRIIYNFIPGFNMFRFPFRFLFLSAIPLSILSGFGLNFLIKDLSLEEREKVWKFVKILAVLTLLLVFVIVVAYAGRNQIIQFGQKMAEQRYYAIDHPSHPLDYYVHYYVQKVYSTIIKDLLTLLALSVGSVILLALRIKKRILIKYFNIIVILFILSNLWFYHIGFIDTKDPKEIYSEPDYVVFLKNNSAGYRVYDIDNKIEDNFQIIYGIHTLNAFNPLKIRYYNQTLGCIHNLTDNKNHPILNLLNVKYILTSTQLNNSGFKLVFNKNNTYIYENEQVLPKAFVIHNVKIKSEKDVIKELKSESFDPIDAVILEQKVNSETLSNDGFEKAEIKEYSPNEIILEANITQPGFLVLSEIYYPNWKVYVDGKQREVYKAYHTLRAVYLDKGQHTVRFTYDPSSLRIGSWITLFTSILLVVTVSMKITYLKLPKLKQRYKRGKPK